MKKKKLIALLSVCSILLTGCYHTVHPPIDETSDDAAYTQPITYETVNTDEITEAAVATTVAAEETAAVTCETEETEPSGTETTDPAGSEEETGETDPEESSAAQSSAALQATTTAQAPPVVTNPPPVVTTQAPPPVTTAAPIVTTAAPVKPITPSAPTIYNNSASGTLTDSNQLATIDYSNTSDGYVMAKYTGSVSLIKVQVKGPNGVTQTYTLNSDGSYGSFPLTGGNGTYSITVLENVGGKSYALAHSFSFNVNVSNVLSPYLRPNAYVNFDANNVAVKKASEICGTEMSDVEKVNQVYSWLVDNVSYDYDRAATVKGGALPDMNRVINNKMGICLDYAGTAVAMLRSQNIPTKMVVGYAGPQFHAWIEVYITGTGWVHGDVYFDGSGWKRMDPTYAASSKSSQTILEYIANNSNYRTDYLY